MCWISAGHGGHGAGLGQSHVAYARLDRDHCGGVESDGEKYVETSVERREDIKGGSVKETVTGKEKSG